MKKPMEQKQVIFYMEALKKLTPREVEVLEMTGEGYTSKEIADLLGISSRTVEKHRENINAKLNLNGYNSLKRWCRKVGTT